MGSTEKEIFHYYDRSIVEDGVIVIYSSNLTLHAVVWILYFPFILFIVLITRLILEEELLFGDMIDIAAYGFADVTVPAILVVGFLMMSAETVRILRVQVDRKSNSVIWEKMSIRENWRVRRTLSDANAVLQPKQARLFPEPAKLVFADGALPIEIRRAWRNRGFARARDIADFAGIPLIEE